MTSLQECTDHTADGICWKCAPDDQCPDWWLELRGRGGPICARPRYRNPVHHSNAVESKYASRDTWYRKTA